MFYGCVIPSIVLVGYKSIVESLLDKHLFLICLFLFYFNHVNGVEAGLKTVICLLHLVKKSRNYHMGVGKRNTEIGVTQK